jgi:hypothetical protein
MRGSEIPAACEWPNTRFETAASRERLAYPRPPHSLNPGISRACVLLRAIGEEILALGANHRYRLPSWCLPDRHCRQSLADDIVAKYAANAIHCVALSIPG